METARQLKKADDWSELVQQYRADGVIVVRRILEGTAVGDIAQGWEALKAGIADGSVARNARFVSGSLPGSIASLWKDLRLVTAAQALLGTSNIALYMNRILLKDREWSDAVAIHQDMPYFSGGFEKVSVFVPLTPTMARHGNGGLIFIKASHKYGNLQRGTVRREVFPAMEEIAPDLAVGDAVFMDFLTWHYSDSAPIPSERPLLQITYQPSTDGSYGSAALGVPEPTLVSGKWLTKHFAAWGLSTTPDA